MAVVDTEAVLEDVVENDEDDEVDGKAETDVRGERDVDTEAHDDGEGVRLELADSLGDAD